MRVFWMALLVFSFTTSLAPAASEGPKQGWSYEALYRDGWLATRLLDAPVIGTGGKNIGEVENIAIGPDGRIASIVVEAGGVLDIGDRHVSIPWRDVQAAADFRSVKVPLIEGYTPDYTSAREKVLSLGGARGQNVVREDVETGRRLWFASDLIGDRVYLDKDVEHGTVTDVVFDRSGKAMAVVVDTTGRQLGERLTYAYPLEGFDPGDPSSDRFVVLRHALEAAEREPFDPARLD